ncbi:hypothetical protein D3H65_23650 [Paraflavitalea soli]|uniref:Uncharacterized protein n=1 Tax=Paraflavitalea soli TaxID=2315862 RepID=A0A3B7MYJ3_9BACT|nr:hypothetical protein [Paraflavitalea soli]AXY76805.1 hypothetical protein D3H65_23650 [Paraflavitalea soli]
MKKCLNLLVLTCLLMGSTAAFAQNEEDTPAPATPRWVSEKGYWVVESNVHVPKQYTVRFYNNDQVMVYKEEVQGVVLKLQRRRVKMNLKKVLETAVLAWEKQRQTKENEGWVYNAIQ